MAQKNHDKDIEHLLKYEPYPIVTGAERLAILEKARGILSPEQAQQMLDEVEQMRKEFDRDLPEITCSPCSHSTPIRK